jgi:hypothetical protein
MLASPSASAAGRADRWTLQYESAKGAAPLFAVLALGHKDVWAFGNTATAGLALHWTGGRWHSVRLPAHFAPVDAAASSPDDIWVAGDIIVGNAATSEEILHYNGHRWNRIPVPAPPENYPGDLAVINSHDVWATGGFCAGAACTTLLHWNGRTWSAVNVRAGAAQLEASPTGQLWAVGSSKLNSHEQPVGRVLAYIWTGKSWRYVTGIPHRGRLATCCGFTVTANDDVWIENAHWNGKRWSLLRLQAGQPVESPIIDDGRGGVWFGPWAHWMGGSTWINTLLPPYGPQLPGTGIGLESLARIPGTTTVIGAGDRIVGSREYAVILAFGKLP